MKNYTSHRSALLYFSLIVFFSLFSFSNLYAQGGSNFEVECEDGTRVDFLTDGMYGDATKNFNIVTLIDDTSFDKDYVTELQLIAYFKGTSGYPATVDFTVNGTTQTANASQDAGTKGATYYKTTFTYSSPTAVTTFAVDPAGTATSIRSVVAYVFSEPPAFQGAFAGQLGVVTSLYFGSGTINDLIPDGNNDDCVQELFDIPESATDRDITLKFAFSEFTPDGRASYVKLTPVGAGGYTPVEEYFTVQNAGDEAAIGTVNLPNVPAGVTQIDILVCSRSPASNPGGVNGQSAVYAGVFIDASETCLAECPSNLGTIVQPTCGENNGQIPVDVSTGPDGDYTYTLTPSAGASTVITKTSKTHTFQNLAAATCTVLVEGPFSCEDEFTVTLTNDNSAGCSSCNLAITGTSNSSCSNGTVSIDVTVSWSEAPAGENIEVKIGSAVQTVNVSSPNSSATVQFTVPGNGAANNIITAQFENGTCYDSDGSTYTAPCCPNGCEEVTINKQ
ncbi:MAG: hypothetical protein AB8B69_00535 [Chitinophagales bacterium]